MSSTNMTNLTKGLLVFGVVAGVFGLAAFFGLSPFARTLVQQIAGTSATGSVFNTAKVAATNFTPSAAAASSTSILNTDASARYITDNFVDCNGTNGQGVTIQAATTTVANLGLQGNTNLVMNTFGTTTTTGNNFLVSSSTGITIPGIGLQWPSNTYLTFIATSSAINTGVCTVGVHYLAS